MIYKIIKPSSIFKYIKFICVLALISCDPMKHVLITNYTKKDVIIEILQDTTHHLSFGPETKHQLTLNGLGKNSEALFVYGFGVFSEEELNSFNLMIKEIRIETEDDSCRINGEKLFFYLPKKRRGLLNNRLEISIQNCP